ncbi:cyclic nucleotide-binding domain-containing protein [Chondromyces apiculatus]|uniref:Regulatory protein n=1 Tax=Chondromyces apiculatus DSM 436 TaxID=1192034 RepID=A0A017T9G9_9BACT|nr:cyclic nucleotide-binding domain-containing protein [Chondromyces apiculatus]EYF05542.1 regulatory protein [Chondromyces apiculatus DSM 436]
MSVGFEFLTQDDERLLLERAVRTRYKPGELILEEGSRRQAVFVIKSGLAGVEVAHLGRGVGIRQLGPGAVFGEVSFLESAAASASVVAREEAEVDIIEGPYVHSLLGSVPGLAARFYQSLAVMLAKRLRENTAMLPPLLVEDVPQVKRFHGVRTGQGGTSDLPPKLVDAVEEFKTEMMGADRLVKDSKVGEAEIQTKVSAACTSMMSRLRDQIVADRHLEKGIGAYVFRETFSFFMLSRLLERAYMKPRGYAGDFFTIEMIYNDEPAGDGRLGRFIDRWALDIAACQAVKNRRGVLSGVIREALNTHQGTTLSVTSLASGPARELFDLFSAQPQPDLKATCIDIDNQALTYAAGIADVLSVKEHFSFTQDNVVRLAHGRGNTMLQPQHLIYSIGLTDYLREELVVKMINWIYDRLLPGGMAVIGNFESSNPNKAFMDHVVEWELIHRTADDMRAMFARSKFQGSPLTVRAEDAGVNLFAVAQRT